MNNIFKLGFAVFVLIWGFSPIKIEAQTVTINSGWQFVLGVKTPENWQTINIPRTGNNDDAFDDKGLSISLKPIEGLPVISGVLIEKMN